MLGPWILEHLPAHRTYVEPFGGGASVLLRKPRSYTEVYNDLDDEIVSFFRVVRDHGDELARRLELTPFSRIEFQEAYASTTDEIERARRTVIRSFMGFGSDGVHSTHRTGFRAKSQRSGTTPAHGWRNYPESLRLIVERFRAVVIEHEPALKVIERFDGAGVCFYVDPPYVHSTRCRVDATRGYRHEMTDDDHRELAAVLNRVRGSVVLSGYPCELYDELYAGWQRVERTGPLADGARERTEVLWFRNCEQDLFTINAA